MTDGNPSDARVYRWRDGWELVGPELDVEPVEPPLLRGYRPTAA
jgi:hypothetical protein